MPSYEPIAEDHLLRVLESDNHYHHQPLPEAGRRTSALIRSREIQQSSREFEEWLSRNQHLFQDESHHAPQTFCGDDENNNTDTTVSEGQRMESICPNATMTIPTRRNSNPERTSFRIGDEFVPTNVESVARCDQETMNDYFNSSMPSLPGAFPATGRPFGAAVVDPEYTTANVTLPAEPGIHAVREPAMNPTSAMYQAAYGATGRPSSPNTRAAARSQAILDYDRMSSRRFESWLAEQQQQYEQDESEETTRTTGITQPPDTGMESPRTEQRLDVPKPSTNHPIQRDSPAATQSHRRCSSTGSMKMSELMEPSFLNSLPAELRPSPQDLLQDSMQTYGSNNNSATRYLHHKAYLENNGSNTTTERSLSEEFVRDSIRSNTHPKSLHDSASKFLDVLSLGTMEDKVLDTMEVAERKFGKVTKAVFTKAPKKVVNGVGAGTKKVVSKISRGFNKSREKRKSQRHDVV